MLSYQHAYHAGNAADVHKHVTLVTLLGHLCRKDKPFCFVDAHAGRGIYDLQSLEAKKTGEAETGIGRLLAAQARDLAALPPPVRRYLDAVGQCRAAGADERRYPGSPALARALMRADDHAILLELHPAEHAALRAHFGGDKRVEIHRRDCYEGLPALLPPRIRRGLVLIDPSYEIKDEFDTIPQLVGTALERWPTGIYALWYPLLPAARHRRMLEGLAPLVPTGTLVSELAHAPYAERLQGSGMVIVNPPWQSEDALAAAMTYVADALGASAAHTSSRLC